VMKKINPNFARHFGGTLTKVMQKAKKGDFDTLWNLLPFLVVAAEMYNDADARQGLEFLFKTVSSADDVIAWIDYIGLPADGWDGEGAPPSVPAFTDQPQDASALQPLSWLISSAYAAPKIRRVVSIDFGKTLKELAKQGTGDEVKNLAGAMRVIKKELNVTQFPDIRKYVFWKEML